MRIKPVLALVPALIALAATGVLRGQQAQPAPADAATVERGRVLTIEADCAPCHTAPGGQPYAGGLTLQTPMGKLASANITPDNATGIGTWSADDFWRALHEGQSKSVGHLYPAMPYNYFTRISRADSDAMFAYLRSIPAVSHSPKRDQLPFPLNIRPVMMVWNALFFRSGQFAANPAKSADWNRGAYLVEVLGHCGACHTPMNFMGAPKTSKYLQGGAIENWFAPDLTTNTRKGLGGWNRQDLLDFLKTGRNAHANVAGPMGDVVSKSTSQMSDADLAAIATYLADQKASPAAAASTPSQAVMAQGQALFVDNCAACHRATGDGTPGLFPPLKGHVVVQQSDPTGVLHVLLAGAQSTPTDVRPTPVSMPSFAWKLSDDQIAAVATYARNAWGNAAPVVTAVQVNHLRRKLAPPRKVQAPKVGDMAHPGPDTLAPPGSDSRDNGTAKAGQPAGGA